MTNAEAPHLGIHTGPNESMATLEMLSVGAQRVLSELKARSGQQISVSHLALTAYDSALPAYKAQVSADLALIDPFLSEIGLSDVFVANPVETLASSTNDVPVKSSIGTAPKAALPNASAKVSVKTAPGKGGQDTPGRENKGATRKRRISYRQASPSNDRARITTTTSVIAATGEYSSGHQNGAVTSNASPNNVDTSGPLHKIVFQWLIPAASPTNKVSTSPNSKAAPTNEAVEESSEPNPTLISLYQEPHIPYQATIALLNVGFLNDQQRRLISTDPVDTLNALLPPDLRIPIPASGSSYADRKYMLETAAWLLTFSKADHPRMGVADRMRNLIVRVEQTPHITSEALIETMNKHFLPTP